MARTLSAAAQARINADLSLAAAAKRLGVTPATLRTYERRGLPDSLIEGAAILYGCSSDQFFYSAEYLAALHQTEQRGTPRLSAAGGATTGDRGARRTKRHRIGREPVLEII